MTTLVGMVSNKHVHIAADTLVTSQHSKLGVTNKLIIIDEGTENETCLAIAGSFTSALAVRAILEEFSPASPWDCELNIYKNLLLIHDNLRDSHGLNVKEEETDQYQSSQYEGLVGSRHGLFTFMSTRESLRLYSFGASGSGAEYAIGALEVLGTDRPEANLKRAIQVASAHDKDTNLEVTYWKSPPC